MLLVDDDELVGKSLATSLRKEGFAIVRVEDGDAALPAVNVHSPDLVLLDVRLPGKNGIEVLQEIKVNRPEIPVFVMTAFGSIDNSVTAMREGAHDYLTKPINDADLIRRIRRVLAASTHVQRGGDAVDSTSHTIGQESLIANHPRMREVLQAVQAAAPTRVTILIQGESGTGKTVLARAIHQLSERRDRPFVEVSCGSLPDPLLESELFGYEIGAFTGADRKRQGKFEYADSGTVFLDEIANATPALQIKLLRVLQDRVFERLGSNEPIGTDIRLILATNADLEGAVSEGRFREDLYYRINVVAVSMPPLRERADDIPALASLFLGRYTAEYKKTVDAIDDTVLDFFYRFNWPGNVRELENVVEHAVIMAKAPTIFLSDLPPRYLEHNQDTAAGPAVRPLKQALEIPERDYIVKVLKLNGGNRQKTAEMLSVNRTTLFNKMRKYDLLDDSF